MEAPLGRVGTKFDIGMLCTYLGTDAGAYINGLQRYIRLPHHNMPVPLYPNIPMT